MNISDIQLDDCWIDNEGLHWFCKLISTTTDLYVVTNARMVRYMEHGFHVLTISQFIDNFPDAKLYLRKGRHI